MVVPILQISMVYPQGLTQELLRLMDRYKIYIFLVKQNIYM